MPKIYVYDGNGDLPRRLPFEPSQDFAPLSPPDINFTASDITPDTCPAGVKAYRPERLGSSNGRFPGVILGPETDAHAMPDVFMIQRSPIVSQQFRDLIEANDPIGHEFFPCPLFTADGVEIEGTAYYHLWMGRMLIFDQTNSGTSPKTDIYNPRRFKFLTALPEAAAFAAKQPLWGYSYNKGKIFLSEQMFKKIQSVGLTGLDRYSEPHGKFHQTYGRLESVGVIELPPAGQGFKPRAFQILPRALLQNIVRLILRLFR